MAVSPLVARHTPIQVRKPPQTPLATAVAAANAGVENVADDVSSPAAAKARTTMVNSSFVTNIKTPASITLSKDISDTTSEGYVAISWYVCICVCVRERENESL